MIKELTIKVEEIQCTDCVSDMETILLGMEGILSVVVSYSEERISVGYDSGLLSEERILDIIRKMGLKPRRRNEEK
jgi:copper chaperone CopZ